MEWVGSIPVFRNGTVLFYCLVGRIEWFYYFVWLEGWDGWSYKIS
jgi:hypothetical protein